MRLLLLGHPARTTPETFEREPEEQRACPALTTVPCLRLQYHLSVAQSDGRRSRRAAHITASAKTHCPHASKYGGDVCVKPKEERIASFCESYKTTCGDKKLGDAYANCIKDVEGMDVGKTGAQSMKDTLSCREVCAGVLTRACARATTAFSARAVASPWPYGAHYP